MKLRLIIIPVVVILAGIITYKYWVTTNFHYVATVEATKIDLSARLTSTISSIEVKEGMKKNSVLIVNSDKEIRSVDGRRTISFDATNLAIKTIGKDIVNTAILGSFAKATKLVTLDSLLKVIAEKFPGKLGELNSKMIKEAYEGTKA